MHLGLKENKDIESDGHFLVQIWFSFSGWWSLFKIVSSIQNVCDDAKKMWRIFGDHSNW